METLGRIHSFQSMGTLDGPGVRFVAFLQGCPLRCKCCHNPDTWELDGGETYTAVQVAQKAERFRAYFGKEGGITLSGGEPLLQPAFVQEVFRLCHEAGIHTCLDTSGCMLNEAVKAALAQTDRILLDVKYTSDELYEENAGCSLQSVLRFLSYVNEQRIPVTLRQVIIPTVNDDLDNIRRLKEIARAHTCVDHVELLPFRKICQVKYDRMQLAFPFGHLPEADAALMKRLNAELNA